MVLKLKNLVQENFTGDGDTITLSGVTDADRYFAFADEYVDGDWFPYGIYKKDAGGDIPQSFGYGKFNNDGTVERRDRWYRNGAIPVTNRYPGENNLTLPSGDHYIQVMMHANLADALSDNEKSQAKLYNGILNSDSGGGSTGYAADTQFAFVYELQESAPIDTLELRVNTPQPGALASLGLTKLISGIPDSEYLANGTIDVTSSGAKTVSVNKFLEAGYYFVHYVCDNASVAVNAPGSGIGGKIINWTPLDETQYQGRRSPTGGLGKSGVVGGVLDTAPETVTGINFIGVNERVIFAAMNRG